MTAPRIYVSFPGTAREALGFYEDVFGGGLSLHTNAEFGRTDGAPEAIAHGELSGAVALAGSDTPPGGNSVRLEGVMLSLLGTAEPAVLHEWFDKLSSGGTVVDPLAPKPGAPATARLSTVTGSTGSLATSPAPTNRARPGRA